MTDAQRERQARARADWTPPGPIPPGDEGDEGLRPAEGESLDALTGHWRIFQLKGGHRYSTDDVLAAWCAVDTLAALGLSPGDSLDLGTGIGSVALMCAWALPALRVTGVELQARSLQLAERSARYNGAAQRMRLVKGDVRDLPALGRFGLVTASPPYWRPEDGILSDGPQKAAARFEVTGTVEAYTQAAAEHLGPEGIFCLVFDGRQEARLRAAIRAAGLAPLRVQPVVSREGDEPLLVIAAAAWPDHPRREAAPAAWSSPLLLRLKDGRRSEAFRALRLRMGLPPGPR